MCKFIPSPVLLLLRNPMLSKRHCRRALPLALGCCLISLISLHRPVLAADATPTIAEPASASPFDVTDKSSNLAVLGADDNGEAGLKYTWVATGTPPAVPVFNRNGTNAAKSVKVTFKKKGAYDFSVTITDAVNQSVTSSVTVNVAATLTKITVAPNNKLVNLGSTQQFIASAKDQFATMLNPQPSFDWSVSGGGTINSNGLLTSGTPGGPFSVTAAIGAVNDSATFNVNPPPTIAEPAAVAASPVVGLSTNLSALGADDSSEANLKYTWSSTGPATVTFNPNNSNAAKNSLVTFKKAGAYTLTVTVKDAQGLSATSSVGVTVNQTYSSIKITPAGALSLIHI